MRSTERADPPRRTRLTAEQRRESILTAATDLFATAGYRAVKVSEVAARVGVSEPVVFQNFGSKAALYSAVLDRVTDRFRAELPSLIGRHGSALDLLAHLFSLASGEAPHPEPDAGHAHGRAHEHAGHAHEHAGRSHGMLLADAASLVAAPVLADPVLAEPAVRAARTLAGHLADLLRRGQADGDVRPGIDPDATAWLLLSVLSARTFRSAAMPDAGHLEAAVAALALDVLAAG
jgi:AcrR family transcriptional regulator